MHNDDNNICFGLWRSAIQQEEDQGRKNACHSVPPRKVSHSELLLVLVGSLQYLGRGWILGDDPEESMFISQRCEFIHLPSLLCIWWILFTSKCQRHSRTWELARKCTAMQGPQDVLTVQRLLTTSLLKEFQVKWNQTGASWIQNVLLYHRDLQFNGEPLTTDSTINERLHGKVDWENSDKLWFLHDRAATGCFELYNVLWIEKAFC